MKSLSGPEKQYSCRQVYEEGAALLEELEDGRLDARLLLEHFCGINTNRLLSDPESPVGEEKRGAFLEAARRRAAREPLAYIIGEQSFMGLPFVVSEDVLIPEQDTENLVEEALRLIDDGSRILDLCTGSGCIGLALASSVAAMANAYFMMIMFLKKYRQIGLVESVSKIGKNIVAAVVAVGGSYLVYMGLTSLNVLPMVINLGVAVLVACIVYVVLLWVMKFDEVEMLKGVFKR